MSLLIKNGLIVTALGSYKGDVYVENETIKAIGADFSGHHGNEVEVVDAAGKYILPGGIDPHTHLEMPFMGTYSSDDFNTGTIAAACGGITSLIDFEVVPKGKTVKEAFDSKHKLAGAKAVIDYGFHPCFVEFNEAISNELKDVVELYGAPSFKVFMTYSFRVDDYAFLKILERAKEVGALVQLHAENHSILQFMNEKFEKEGKLGPEYHPKSRPNIAEEEAVSRAIEFTRFLDSQLYIVHLSSREGLEKIVQARDKGLKVYAETCPQYLILNDSCYSEPNWGGAKYVMSPPIRSRESNEQLWRGLAKGDVQTIGSDHCPFHFHGTKDRFGKDDYKKIPNGAPGTETLLMLLHSEGVLKGRISLEKMVEVLSTNTARLFGMRNKGEIAVGKDADIVIFDPNQKYTISYKTLHMNVDYNPYEGREITGMPYMVFSRGKKVAQWNKDRVEFTGKAGAGKFIKRMPFKAI
jgi:dihydropyrimidinase